MKLVPKFYNIDPRTLKKKTLLKKIENEDTKTIKLPKNNFTKFDRLQRISTKKLIFLDNESKFFICYYICIYEISYIYYICYICFSYFIRFTKINIGEKISPNS